MMAWIPVAVLAVAQITVRLIGATATIWQERARANSLCAQMRTASATGVVLLEGEPDGASLAIVPKELASCGGGAAAGPGSEEAPVPALGLGVDCVGKAEGSGRVGGRTLCAFCGPSYSARGVSRQDQQCPTVVWVWAATMSADTQPMSAFGAMTMNQRLVPSYHWESSQQRIWTCSPLTTLRPWGLLQVELVLAQIRSGVLAVMTELKLLAWAIGAAKTSAMLPAATARLVGLNQFLLVVWFCFGSLVRPVAARPAARWAMQDMPFI